MFPSINGTFIKIVCWSLTQSCLTLCDPMDSSSPGSSLSKEFSRQKYWSGLSFPSPKIGYVPSHKGFLGGASGKELTCQCRRHKRCGFNSWVGILQRRAWQPTPVFLPGESHGQRSLVGCSPQAHRESDMTEATQHIRMHARTHVTSHEGSLSKVQRINRETTFSNHNETKLDSVMKW